MTNKIEMEVAFMAGFRAARTRGKPNVKLGPVSERTAQIIFDGWYENQHE